MSLKLNKKVLQDVLNTFHNTNEELMLKKKKEDGLKDSIEALKVSSKIDNFETLLINF